MCDETVLFTPIPECENLSRFICKLNDVIIVNGSPMSFFSSQIYICRFILETFPEIIASPMPGTENYIEIITENDYFQIKKLQIFLKSENMLCSEAKPVSLENYKECVMYTIKYKLSPSWNKFGQYLCQGSDFLITSEEINAIKFDLIMTKKGMYLKFHSFMLQIYPLKLEDLQLNPSLLEEFKQNPEGFIELGQSWFNVLPSLFKARILSVSKQIPSRTPFKNYQELRLHWKNMNGYILPESSEGILYYQVHFRAFPDQVFLYPDVCLHSQAPKIIDYNNHDHTCIEFTEDLKTKVHSICGKTLSFVKDEFTDFKVIPISQNFFPASVIKTEKSNSIVTPLSSAFKTLKPSDSRIVPSSSVFKTPKSSNSKIVPLSSVFKQLMPNDSETSDQKPIVKLKQQTLNFPRKLISAEHLPTNNLEKLDSSIGNSSQDTSNVINILSPQLSKRIMSEYTQSQPIVNRKLTIDQKSDDDISQKNETFDRILNQTNYKNSTQRKTSKERELFNALLQDKSDNDDLKFLEPPPIKKIRIYKQKSSTPPIMESISNYFQEQKPTSHRPIQTQGNRLQLWKLKK